MLFLALRYLRARQRQTLLILFGALLGGAAYVVLSGVLGGFKSYIVGRLISGDAHIRIQAQDLPVVSADVKRALFAREKHVFWISSPLGRRARSYITFPGAWYRRLHQHPQVEAFTPQLVSRANIIRDQAVKPIRLIGTIPSNQDQTTRISDYMLQGRFEDLQSGGHRLVVGKILMERLSTHVEDTVTLVSPRGRTMAFQIAGVFETGVRSYDESTVFASLFEVQELNGEAGGISDIAVRLHDFSQAKTLAQQWLQKYPENIQTWENLNANVLTIYRMQTLIGTLMIASLVAIVAFGIYNILQMLIRQKMQEIAILRAIGFDARDVAVLFLCQGFILGTVGGFLGIVAGFAVTQFLETLQVGGMTVSSGGRMIISYAPAIYARAFLLILIACLVSCILPARTAWRLQPMQIFRSRA